MNISLRSRIEALLRKAKLTQSALAAEIGVSQPSIAYYISDKTTNPRVSYTVVQGVERAEQKYAELLAA